MKNKKTMVLIPALNPPENLIDYIYELKHYGLNDILVVNDGSSERFKKFFEDLKQIDGVTILTHAKNLGKGRALKNAFNFFLTLPNIDDFNGIVTCDSDGQHRAKDVLNIANNVEVYLNSLIIGCRDFDSKNVPPKSKFGNKVTVNVFKLLYRKKITDTQTGLRGFPKSIISEMLDIFGEKFEYETKMLITCFEKNLNIVEIPIETVYYNNNAETHFNAIKDSVKIYKVIFTSFFNYILTSLSSFLIDIGLFKVFVYIFSSSLVKNSYSIFFSSVIARIFSSLFNFFVNKNFVFNGEKSFKKTIYKYYSLCIFQMLLSSFSVSLLWKITNVNETIIKIIVDTILFLISYRVQRTWVFKKTRKKNYEK